MLLLSLALACSHPEAPPEVAPPNVLLVTLDTLRTDGLDAYGSTKGIMPNLDGLARRGIVFDRAYTVTPLTIPAHSSLMTGLLPPRHGVQDNGDFFLQDSATTLAERLSERGYRTMASVGAEVTSHHWGFSQGFSAYFDNMGTSAQQANRWRVERPGDEVVRDALGWFDSQKDQKSPWFSWVHLFDIHHPYAAPEPFASQVHHPYYAEVAWTDSLLGRMLEGLDERHQLDNTWIFVMADHGEGLGAHGESLHGILLYDVTTHIPLIVVPPKGLPAGRRVDFPVSLVDIAPTALALSGAAPLALTDGLDLSPWLGENPPSELRDREVYVESVYAWRHYGWAPQKALVQHTQKLIDSTTPELYSRKDPREKNDLASKSPEKVATLRARLATLTAALVREEGTAGHAASSSERTAMLEALGYVTATADVSESASNLPDPSRNINLLQGVEVIRVAQRAGDLATARTRAEEVLAEDPNLTEVRRLLAEIVGEQGDIPASIAMFEAIEAERPSGTTKVPLGNLLLAQGQVERGISLFEQAIASDPFLAHAWVSYVRALQLTDPERFAAAAEDAAGRFPQDGRLQGYFGAALSQRMDPRAGAILQRAIALDPAQSQVRHLLGALALREGSAAEAEALWLDELALFPGSMATHRALVALYAEQKRFEEQLEHLRVIHASEPPNHLTLHSIAQSLFNLRRYDEARGQVELCRETAPEYPACAMLYANVLDKLGDRPGAEEAYHTALALGEAALTSQGPIE